MGQDETSGHALEPGVARVDVAVAFVGTWYLGRQGMIGVIAVVGGIDHVAVRVYDEDRQ